MSDFKISDSKHIVIVTLFVVIIIGLGFFFVKNINSNLSYMEPPTAAIAIKSNATLILKEEDLERVFEGPLYDSTTVFQSMIAASRAGNFDFEYSYDNNGVLILEKYGELSKNNDEINNGTCAGICVFLNEKPISRLDLDSIIVQPGDVIIVRSSK